MALVNRIAVVATQSIDLQSGITPGKWRIGYLRPGSTLIGEEQRVDEPRAQFNNLTVGATYNFFAQRLDSFGVRIGDEVNASLTVTADPTGPKVDVPLSIFLSPA